MTIYLPALVALLGLVAYFAAQGKISEAGRIAFATGLLAFLFVVATKMVKLP